MTTLVTERLLLRPLRAGDLEPLARILAEPAVSRFWPAYDLERVRQEYFGDGDELVVFAIEHAGEVVGLLQYGEEEDPMYRHASVDLFLRTADHGRGYAREALTAVIDHLFDDREHHRIAIDPAAHNTRAIAAYQKLGFRRVGVLRQYERGPDGAFHDGVLLDLLASDWKKRSRPEAPALSIELRSAKPGDEALILPMMREFNRGELIELADDVLGRALSKLLADPSLGVVWLFALGGEVAGYTVFTFGYDLEFAGRDAIVTEFYVKPEHRRRGVAHRALAEIDRAARALGVGAIHLGVRPDNGAAFRLYEGAGFETSRHVFLTKLIEG